MDHELPYIAEYAKSSRASCKICKSKIEKDCLRMGVMVQSHKFDGKVPLWHHMSCFLKKKQLLTTSDIANFDSLRWEDQKTLKDKVVGVDSGASSSSAAASSYVDFTIEYAKSSRSTCKQCEEKILKGDVRISKLDHDSPDAHRYGPIPRWHHVDCFVKVKADMGFTDSADKLPGYSSLSTEDKEMVTVKFPRAATKRKTEEVKTVPKKVAKLALDEETALQAQSKLIYDLRDKLNENMPKKDMVKLLEVNNQHVSIGISALLDNLTDCLLFGGRGLCPQCKSERPRLKLGEYKCPGHVSEWTKCEFTTKSPEREPFNVPDEFKEAYEFLSGYEYVKRQRLFPANPDLPSAVSGKDKNGLPLQGAKIFLLGRFGIPKTAMSKKAKELGASVGSKVDRSVSLIITTEAEVEGGNNKLEDAEKHKIHVVTPQFLEEVRKGIDVPTAVAKNLLCKWGDDPKEKFKKDKSKAKTSEVDLDSLYKSSMPQKMKLTVQGGAVVDPQSELQEKAFVYRRGDDLFSVVLGKVDVSKGTNKYYKIQLLKSNKLNKFWVFRSWGRTGTTIGGTKIESMNNIDEAVAQFEFLYSENTGNQWKNHKNFVKMPGKLYPLDIDYRQENQEEVRELKPGANSTLPKQIQDLIMFIFDINAMKDAMIEFEIDLKKMPLGKISKNQIEKAFLVLTEVQEILQADANPMKILDASNRFYTLIPHDFGLRKPPLLDDRELVKSKVEMLDSLLEIEFAYSLLRGTAVDKEKDPVTEHYEKLNTDIEVLKKDTDEYNRIHTYLKNTHASTHDQYELKLDEVFKINRHGENEKYQQFKDLHNKKLLWHGSRFTNFVGILSQGLRIAPPEAPASGYMFGKGIYFADMVSKSANYCFTTRKNPTGLLLLCEVALGNMLEKTAADYINKLPKNKHSTMGKGITVPDPTVKEVVDNVEIPFGMPVKSNIGTSSLLYNEYIIYNANQVNIKYLLKVNFKWKR